MDAVTVYQWIAFNLRNLYISGMTSDRRRRAPAAAPCRPTLPRGAALVDGGTHRT